MGYRVATPSISSRRQDGKQQKNMQKHYVSRHENMHVVVERHEIHAERVATVNDQAMRRVSNRRVQTATIVSDTAVQWRQHAIVAVRIIFGCWWGVDAWLKCQTAFLSRSTTYLAQALHPLSPMMTRWFAIWLQVAYLQPHFFAYSVIVVEFCIACCLLFGVCNAIACGTGICLSLFGWLVIDGMGGLWGRSSIDSGIIVVYVLIFLGLMMGKAGQKRGVTRFMADAGRFQKKPAVKPIRQHQQSTETHAKRHMH